MVAIYTSIGSKRLLDLAEGRNLNEIRDLVQELEGLGVAGIAVNDKIISPGWLHRPGSGREKDGRSDADPFVLLGFLAAMTERLRLATRIMIAPNRQPFAMAHAWSTLDVLSAGRAIIGLGVGYDEDEFRVFRIPRGRRGAITDEWLEIMTGLMENEKFSYSGRHYAFEDVSLRVRPVQQPHPPLWHGGFARGVVRRTVRFGGSWTPNCFDYEEGPLPGEKNGLSRGEFERELRWAAEECDRLGRPPIGVVLSTGRPVHLTASVQHPGRSRSEIEYFSNTGTPTEIREEFLAFQAAGANDFFSTFSGETAADWLQTARTFMREVAPALQEAAR